MDKTLGIFLAVYSLILWVAIFFVWHKGYKEWKSNRANRVRKYHARVLDKREIKSTEGVPQPHVLFEFNGRQVEFAVDPSVFSALRVGEEGVLELRGSQFESFQPKTQDQREDDIYRRMVKG